MNMRNQPYLLLLLVSLIGLAQPARAQASYHGGAGDGYARATWQVGTSNLTQNLDAGEFEAVPTSVPSGGEVVIQVPFAQRGTLKMKDMQGRELAIWKLEATGTHRVSLPEITSGRYWLVLETSTKTLNTPIWILP